MLELIYLDSMSIKIIRYKYLSMPWILKGFGVIENRTKLLQTGCLGVKFHKLLHLLMK